MRTQGIPISVPFVAQQCTDYDYGPAMACGAFPPSVSSAALAAFWATEVQALLVEFSEGKCEKLDQGLMEAYVRRWGMDVVANVTCLSEARNATTRCNRVSAAIHTAAYFPHRTQQGRVCVWEGGSFYQFQK